jgi:predicted Rossmann fold flavoprotein
MFTHAGITGPSVFAFSAKTAFVDCSPSSPLSVLLIVDALKSFEDWDRELSLAFGANGSKELKNVLSAFFPRRLAETLPALAALPAEKKAALVSRDERRTLARLLSDGIVLKLNGRRPGEEFVTAGGVALSEIDPETMESKKVPNLYFTGEVLDVDGVTGGFNLQACWATGRAAGNAVGGRVGNAVG